MDSPPVVALFGPTGVGKTAVAIELGSLLAARGRDAVAVNCDSIQIYAGLGILSGAPDRRQREELEHRLIGFVPVDEEFSAGRYARRAHAEIDTLTASGIWPLVVGGTGLYLRAALADLELRPPVPEPVRAGVEAELHEDGPEKLHARLPGRFRRWISPHDRKRIARVTELLRVGREPAPDSRHGGRLWTHDLRRPAVLVVLVMERNELATRISRRVEAMDAAGVRDEIRTATAAGASRTARAAIGYREFPAGDLDRVKLLHRRYARRQVTWMRRMEKVTLIDRTGLSDRETAHRILAATTGRRGVTPESTEHRP